ncbi:MAG: microcystin degradation protein MlrC-like protein [Devosia sp.]|uniref:M81 family metallopeptidase n=1 Tax=Devosia sp. TaxID=1871048 RepID=UPI002601E0D1|nr:M81 family metallopeptidase [Devosia sp.]MDB5542284.1 microcystin degradation protein MlrC-like protein [Devosia sp.]
MRLFIATLGTETNTFASFPTGLDDFKACLWAEGNIETFPASPWTSPGQIWLERGREEGWEVVQSLFAFANPAGPTVRKDYEAMRDRILGDLAAAGEVDAVLLYLHGAMVADGYDDCEGDLVTRIRQQVGKRTKIGVELDLHGHVDNTIVDASDLIVIYKTYPHIDHAERAHDLFELMKRLLAGEIDPKMALFDCKSMGLFPTTMEGPMIEFSKAIIEAEGKDGILSLSLNHGFPWADVPLAGAKMLAIADGDMGVAAEAAKRFGEWFYRIRKEATLPFTPFAEAIEEAKIKGEKPLLIADTADQIGSGAPGDTTYVLKAFIDAGIRNAAIAPLWDPLAVNICFQVGVGGKLKLRIGGKYEPHSGPAHDADAEVLFLKRNAWQDHLADERIDIGDVAVVRVEGIEVLLTTLRTNLYSLSLLTLHGISFDDKQVVSIKNLYKHKDLFVDNTRKQLFVATPGTSNPDWSALPFKRVPRPMWPLDADPLGLDG